MTETAWNVLASTMSFVFFGAGLVAVLLMPSRPGGFMRSGIKVLLGGAMAIYTFVGLSHILQFLQITSALDIFENYLKVLFIPLIAAAGYAVRMNEQLRVTERQAHVLSAEHDMLMRVVDTTPTGLVVLDQTGRIEFANDKAKQILEIAEDPAMSTPRTPAWTCQGDAEPGVMSACIGPQPVRDERRTVSWPDGRAVQLLLNATPIIASDGSSVGAVVAFTAEEMSATA